MFQYAQQKYSNLSIKNQQQLSNNSTPQNNFKQFKNQQSINLNTLSAPLEATKNNSAASNIEQRLIQFLPSLIHDLRNPLQQLFASVELYKGQLHQMQNPLYGILSKSIIHMSELITKALITFQMIIERKDQDLINELKYQKVDISQYLEEFWTNNLPIAESKTNVDYQILVQSSLPHYVNIPKLEVTQVIQNLFSNATKFTEKGSIKLIVSFHEVFEEEEEGFHDDNAKLSSNTQEIDLYQQNKSSTQQNEHQDKLRAKEASQDQHLKNQGFNQKLNQQDFVNKISYDGCKESSPMEQDASIKIEESQKSNQQQIIQLESAQQTPTSLKKIASSSRNPNINTENTLQAQNQFNNDKKFSNLKGFGEKQIVSQRLKQQLQSITNQFNKLKYSKQQYSDNYAFTQEDIDEDYSESNNKYSFTPHPPYSTQNKPSNGNSEYYQVKNFTNEDKFYKTQNSFTSTYHGFQFKNQPSQYSSSSYTNLNLNIVTQQSNIATPSSINNHNINNIESNQNNLIFSYNQIENSQTSSASRSCHNSTPPTYQIHTFSDLQNSNNSNQLNMIKSQQLSSARQTPKENSFPIHDYSTQYHTPQINPKRNDQIIKYNGQYSSEQTRSSHNFMNNNKNQTHNSQCSNKTNEQSKEIGSKFFFTDYPSPDITSIHNQAKNQGQNNINLQSYDRNGQLKSNQTHDDAQKKNLSSIAPNQNLQNYIQQTNQGLKKQITLSDVMKQQQQNKQNKMNAQNNINNTQQKQNYSSNEDLKYLQKHQQEGNIQKIGHQQQNNKIQNNQQKITEKAFYQDSNSQNNQISESLTNICYNPLQENLPNNNEFCQIFSKRKSQIHPSIIDLVFSRNNIRNYQIRKKAQTKGYLKFEILDTGKGMDENEQKRIFNIYQQANSSIKKYYGGTGIGLYSAKNIASQLQGNIYCHSHKGVGSAFIFYMPCEATYKTDENQNTKDLEKKLFDNSIQLQQNEQMMQSQNSQNNPQKQSQQQVNQSQKSQNSNSNQKNFFMSNSQDKYQQLQIVNINQGLKNADILNTKFNQESKHVIIKHQQQQQNTIYSPSQQQEQEQSKLINQLEKKSIKMIYIDDSYFLLQTMEKQLSKIKSIELTIEQSALKGFSKIKQNPTKYDIALIDNEMPELNGKKLAQEIKQINPNIILVFHSGYVMTPDFKQECFQSGFSYFLDKPCFFEHIVLLLSQIYKIDNENFKQLINNKKSGK